MAAIVFVERAQRKIPIQYARRVVGRRVYGGASTYLPLRVNTGGVIPVIFASSMLAIPQTIGTIGALQDVQLGAERCCGSWTTRRRSTTCSTSR